MFNNCWETLFKMHLNSAQYDNMWFSSTANESVMLKYNERFDWAWGTKLDCNDYSKSGQGKKPLQRKFTPF